MIGKRDVLEINDQLNYSKEDFIFESSEFLEKVYQLQNKISTKNFTPDI